MRPYSFYIRAYVICFVLIAFAFSLFPKHSAAICFFKEIAQYRADENNTYICTDCARDASNVSPDAPKETKTPDSIFAACKNDKGFSSESCLLSMAFRASFSSIDVIGGKASEEFSSADLALNFKLPWAYYSPSGWGGGIRVMPGVAILNGADDNALIVSLIPMLTFGSMDGRFTLDMGAGGALFSRHRFGNQDFGGHFQFALTSGISIPLFKDFGAGYRFLHYSDAAIYGKGNTGADLHMLELIYRF